MFKASFSCYTLLFLTFVILSSCFPDNKKQGNSDESAVGISVSSDVTITDAEMEQGELIYFDKCAGCHGSSRKGATGPSLLPDGNGKDISMKDLTPAGIKVFIENGTPGGMPEWKGIMSEGEIELMTRFLMVDPPAIPEFGMDEIKNTWNLIIPVVDRPTKPMHDRNIDNFFGVIMRDAGNVAVIDGDTKEKLAVLKTGFAVHILRTSASLVDIFILWVEMEGLR